MAVIAPTGTLPSGPGSDAWMGAEPEPGMAVLPTVMDGLTVVSPTVKKATLPASKTVDLGTCTGCSVLLVNVTNPLAGWFGKSRWPVALTTLVPSTSPDVTNLAGMRAFATSTPGMDESAAIDTSIGRFVATGVTVTDAAGMTKKAMKPASAARHRPPTAETMLRRANTGSACPCGREFSCRND